MPIKYTTFTEEEFKFFNNFAEKIENEDLEFEDEEFSRIAVGLKMMLENLKEYQNQRLKINKESRESKMAARKEGGGGRSSGAKMTGAVKLVPIDLDKGIFTVEKVKIPAAPVPAPEPEPVVEPVVAEPEREEAVKTKKVQQKKINTARAKATPKLVRKTADAPAPAPAVIPKYLQEEHDNDSDATVTDDEE